MTYRLFWRGKSCTTCANRPRRGAAGATGLSAATEPLRPAIEPGREDMEVLCHCDTPIPLWYTGRTIQSTEAL